MRSFRLATMVAGAAIATILSAGSVLAGVPTPPEQQNGSVGEYLIRDSSGTTAAACRYADSGPLKLRSIMVKGPEARWPDTNADNDHQHGMVRHRIVVQRSINEGASGKRVASSTPQTKVAYENESADFTKRTVRIDIAKANAIVRVYSKVEWLRPNGTVRGVLKHWCQYARWTSDQLQGVIEQGPCPNRADA